MRSESGLSLPGLERILQGDIEKEHQTEPSERLTEPMVKECDFYVGTGSLRPPNETVRHSPPSATISFTINQPSTRMNQPSSGHRSLESGSRLFGHEARLEVNLEGTARMGYTNILLHQPPRKSARKWDAHSLLAEVLE